MDPAEFGISTLPLQHAPYPAISPSVLINSLVNRVSVITGAAQGIGAGIAQSLAQAGSNVAVLDLSLDKLEDTVAACQQHGVKVKAYVCDVSNQAAVNAVFDEVEVDLGQIEILVNNAGIIDVRPLIMSSFESFWRQIEVNFKGPLLTIHNVLPRMRKQGGGCIINIASRSGTVDVPMTMGYVTSKAALIRATHTLQKEMELDGVDPAIHLYALHPGGVLTGMGGSGPDPDITEKYGKGVPEADFLNLFKDPPALCGQTCAFLASGRAKDLRGLYLDCRQDLTKLLEIGREELLKQRLNTLTVNFLEGYCNEP